MKILVVNAGSSSIKYQLIDMDGEKLMAKGLVERIGDEKNSILTHKANGKAYEIKQPLKNHAMGLELVLNTLVDKEKGVIKSLDEISAIGHRVAHGGEDYKSAVLIDDAVLKNLQKNVALAPLHMPANLLGVEACKKVMAGKKNVAVFDTAFHSTMPDYAYMYAVPYSWYEKYGVRRYGFHGTSHEFIANELAKILKKDIKDLKIITCHIGNGASVSAIKYGKCIDTSMGFTPLEGVSMGTRSGDIDPAVVEYIMDKTGMSVHETIEVLNKKSGLLGLSEHSNDHRDIVARANEGDPKSILASNRYDYMVKKYIGSYSAAMNGVDAIIFSAGIGENSYEFREGVMKDMEYLGVDFDFEANKNFKRGENFKISKDSSKVAVYIIPTNEELSMARQTKAILEKK